MSDKMLRSLPKNMTDRTRIRHRVDGMVRNDPVSADVALLPTERALPIRRFFSWPGKRNYDGSWWSSTVRAHVLFESLLEREYLLAADFDPGVVGIAAQPAALLWPRGTSGQKHHFPDYFVRLQNGDGRLVDVRHPKHVEKGAVQFAMTRSPAREPAGQLVRTGYANPVRDLWPDAVLDAAQARCASPRLRKARTGIGEPSNTAS